MIWKCKKNSIFDPGTEFYKIRIMKVFFNWNNSSQIHTRRNKVRKKTFCKRIVLIGSPKKVTAESFWQAK